MTRSHIAPSWHPLPDGHATSPLGGVRVLDFSALGPGPFCTMLLAAYGADVIAISRPGPVDDQLDNSHFDRGKRHLQLDLKTPEGREIARGLAEDADVVVEGFRPGVMERLGLGPNQLMENHRALIYARLTGFGQDGPYAQRAGHDINYLAAAGALGVIDRPPLALLGDFAGGAFTTLIGVLLALRTRDRTGDGDIIDASIVDGVSLLMYSTTTNTSNPGRVRMLDGTAPFYTTYPCADGRRFSVGAIESRFFAELLKCLDIDDPDFLERQHDEDFWPQMRATITERFLRRKRDEWAEVFASVDACAMPVLELGELPFDAHLSARGTCRMDRDQIRVGLAPRFRNRPNISISADGNAPEARLSP